MEIVAVACCVCGKEIPEDQALYWYSCRKFHLLQLALNVKHYFTAVTSAGLRIGYLRTIQITVISNGVAK